MRELKASEILRVRKKFKKNYLKRIGKIDRDLSKSIDKVVRDFYNTIRQRCDKGGNHGVSITLTTRDRI